MKSIKETLQKYYPNAENELNKGQIRKVYAAMIDLADAVATERVKNISSSSVLAAPLPDEKTILLYEKLTGIKREVITGIMAGNGS
jgi:hypothetical protein